MYEESNMFHNVRRDGNSLYRAVIGALRHDKALGILSCIDIRCLRRAIADLVRTQTLARTMLKQLHSRGKPESTSSVMFEIWVRAGSRFDSLSLDEMQSMYAAIVETSQANSDDIQLEMMKMWLQNYGIRMRMYDGKTITKKAKEILISRIDDGLHFRWVSFDK
jgi:hypothetical protein